MLCPTPDPTLFFLAGQPLPFLRAALGAWHATAARAGAAQLAARALAASGKHLVCLSHTCICQRRTCTAHESDRSKSVNDGDPRKAFRRLQHFLSDYHHKFFLLRPYLKGFLSGPVRNVGWTHSNFQLIMGRVNELAVRWFWEQSTWSS